MPRLIVPNKQKKQVKTKRGKHAMNFKYIYALLLILGMALFFAPAKAQSKKQTKKTTKKAPAKPAPKKPAAKPAAKPVVKKPAAGAANKSAAQNLGEAIALTVQDTTKKGDINNPDKNNASLSEEIIVTTAYKPVLADAVKIRRNPDLEDKNPFKAPLAYTPLDKKLDQDSEIKRLDAQKRPAE